MYEQTLLGDVRILEEIVLDSYGHKISPPKLPSQKRTKLQLCDHLLAASYCMIHNACNNCQGWVIEGEA